MKLTTTLLEDNEAAFKVPHPLKQGNLWLPKSRCHYEWDPPHPATMTGPVGNEVRVTIPDDLAKAMKLSTHFDSSEKVLTESRRVPRQQPVPAVSTPQRARVSRDPLRPEVQPTPAVRNGTYTVEFTSIDVSGDPRFAGQHRTIRITAWDKRPGYQVAAYLFGPNNSTDFRGFATVAGNEAAIWTSYRGREDALVVRALDVILANDEEGLMKAGEAYAMMSGRCCICGRTLTVPASIHRGMGPDCWMMNAPLEDIIKTVKGNRKEDGE